MPWECKSAGCGTMVPIDVPLCPVCGNQKTAWTVEIDRTRTMVVAKRAKLDCFRGEGLVTEAASPCAHEGVAWRTSEVASVVTKERARALQQERRLPAPRDVLRVRLFPAKQKTWELRLAVAFEKKAVAEEVLAWTPDPARLDDEGAFALHLLCVHGPGDAAGLSLPGLRVIDVSDATPLGHAPHLELGLGKAKPVRVRLEPSEPPPAQVWTARWEGEASFDAAATMIVESPGLAAGTKVAFEVEQVGAGPIGKVEAVAAAGRAEARWDGWYQPRAVPAPVHVEAPGRFPPVSFVFSAQGPGGSAKSPPLVYADRLNAQLVERGAGQPLERLAYTLKSPFGTYAGTTDEQGLAVVEGLPPGGVYVLVGDELATGGAP